MRYKSHTEIHTADVENLIAFPLDAGNRYWIRYYILKLCPFLNHIVCGLRSMRLLFIVFFGRHEILSIENKTKKQNKQPKKNPIPKNSSAIIWFRVLFFFFFHIITYALKCWHIVTLKRQSKLVNQKMDRQFKWNSKKSHRKRLVGNQTTNMFPFVFQRFDIFVAFIVYVRRACNLKR